MCARTLRSLRRQRGWFGRQSGWTTRGPTEGWPWPDRRLVPASKRYPAEGSACDSVTSAGMARFSTTQKKPPVPGKHTHITDQQAKLYHSREAAAAKAGFSASPRSVGGVLGQRDRALRASPGLRPITLL